MAHRKLRAWLAAPLATALALSFATVPQATADENAIRINEVESDGDPVGDWVELTNTGSEPQDISGWLIIDDKDDRDPIVVPEGTTVAPGGFYRVYTQGDQVPDGAETFGLGKKDQVRVYTPSKMLVDEYAWDGHAIDTFGRIPDGSGEFLETKATPGAANAKLELDPDAFNPKTAMPVESTVVINEIESNGDPVADWVELYNTGTEPVDVSGWLVIDDDDTRTPLVVPDSTVIAPGGFYRFYTEGQYVLGGEGGFGLGKNDKVRVYTPDNELVAEETWDGHAAGTWGRLPDGTGAFAETNSTPGKPNEAYVAPAPLDSESWPYDPIEVTDIDLGPEFSVEDMSGVDFDADGRAWIVNNGSGTLWAVAYDAASNSYTLEGNWQLRYPDGTGEPDAEGITVGPDGALYVATERNNADKNISRPSVLRFELPTSEGGELVASDEWNLAQHTGPLGANTGLEAVSYVPGIGTNLYAVGVEAYGNVLFVELGTGGASTLVQVYDSPFDGVMALDWDEVDQELRVLCDEACEGQSILLAHDGTEFAETSPVQDRPDAMPNHANEGYAKFTATGECEAGKQTTTTRFLWVDDGVSNDVALRSAVRTATVDCDGADTVKPAPKPQRPVPGLPGNPGMPSTPSTPGAAESPVAPSTPSTPSTPDTSDAADAADAADGSALTSKCTAALVGWGVPLLVLIPVAIATQLGLPGVSSAVSQAEAIMKDANTRLQQQLGAFNPDMARQVEQLNASIAQYGPLAGAVVIGASAIATIATACAPTPSA